MMRQTEDASRRANVPQYSKKAENIRPDRALSKITPENRPQVVFRNLPGAKWIVRTIPSLDGQMENFALTNPGGIADSLITGCAADDEGNIRLRIGGDVRRIPRAEIRANFAGRIKWAVLAVLLYYSLTFSIFAQTVGMWFWGIFLTRSHVTEVLPFRAVLYTVCMLLFGILMIPMVLITKRSLADWICGVRQIGVGSVSKS